MTTGAGVPQTCVLRVLYRSLGGKTPPRRAAYPRNPTPDLQLGTQAQRHGMTEPTHPYFRAGAQPPDPQNPRTLGPFKGLRKPDRTRL